MSLGTTGNLKLQKSFSSVQEAEEWIACLKNQAALQLGAETFAAWSTFYGWTRHSYDSVQVTIKFTISEPTPRLPL